MSDIVQQLNIGALIATASAIGPVVDSANSTTTHTGITIDRFSNGMPESMVSAINYAYTGTAGKKVTISSAFYDSADGSSWAAYGSTQASLVVGSTASTQSQSSIGVETFSINLSSARRYIRQDVTTSFTATGVDTCGISAMAIMGGKSVYS